MHVLKLLSIGSIDVQVMTRKEGNFQSISVLSFFSVIVFLDTNGMLHLVLKEKGTHAYQVFLQDHSS